MIDVFLPLAMTSLVTEKDRRCTTVLAPNFILIYIAVGNNAVQRRDSIKKYLFSARKHERQHSNNYSVVCFCRTNNNMFIYNAVSSPRFSSRLYIVHIILKSLENLINRIPL